MNNQSEIKNDQTISRQTNIYVYILCVGKSLILNDFIFLLVFFFFFWIRKDFSLETV